jgi:hypothetical protein
MEKSNKELSYKVIILKTIRKAYIQNKGAFVKSRKIMTLAHLKTLLLKIEMRLNSGKKISYHKTYQRVETAKTKR